MSEEILDKDNYFRDGKRIIDYILVLNYDIVKKPDDMHPVVDFMTFLEKRGLEFELEKGTRREYLFLKVHCPQIPLEQFATLYGVDIFSAGHSNYLFNEHAKKNRFFKFFDNELSSLGLDTFVRDWAGKASRAERIMTVQKIMTASSFQGYNLTQLLRKGLVKDAFPLHDGECEGTKDIDEMNERELLTKYWANKPFYKKQPLNLLEKYYGPEVAYHFAWLGFYNKMLIPATLVAILCLINISFFDFFSFSKQTVKCITFRQTSIYFPPVIYGRLLDGTGPIAGDPKPRHGRQTFHSADAYANKNEICTSQMMVCPICHSMSECMVYPLNATCPIAPLINFFDDDAGVLVVFLMPIWAMFVAQFWKRNENMLKIRWHLQYSTDVKLRPEFSEKTQYRRISPLTGEIEPYVPTAVKFLRLVVSKLMTLILVFLLFVLVILLIMAKLHIRKSLIIRKSSFLWAPIISTNVVSFIQMLVIRFCSLWTIPLSHWLTELENPRTQKDYDSAVIFKSYLLAFFNHYLTLLYHSLLHGRLYHPHNTGFITFFDYDVCEMSGCMFFLSVQTLYILAWKIPLFSLMQYFYAARKLKNKRLIMMKDMPLWERDFRLEPVGHHHFLEEYLQEMIQFGLVTFFAAPMPIGPMIAIIINIIQIRMSSNKLIRLYRRPVPKQVSGLGEWNKILRTVTLCCVITNTTILCTVSYVIPKLVYTRFRGHHSLRGYLEFMMSELDRRDIAEIRNEKFLHNIATCHYLGMYHPPSSPSRYQSTYDDWEMGMIRILAIIIIEHSVFSVTSIIGYMIPELPNSVKEQLAYEKKNDQAMRQVKITRNKPHQGRNTRPSM